MADQQLHQANELRHEKYEGKDNKSEECVAENLAEYIAVQDAHGANGECNTAACWSWPTVAGYGGTKGP